MAFPRLWNPGMGGLVQDQPSRLRMPTPMAGSPYASTPALQQFVGAGGSPRGGVPAPKFPSPAPSLHRSQYPGTIPEGTSIPQPVAPPAPKLEVTPFMTNMYKSIQNIDPEQRGEYLSTTSVSIKDRMDRYEFRIARGIPLSPEMQRQYDSLRGAYNDIQKYINNPAPYDALFGQWSANISQGQQAANPNRGAENQIAMGRRFAGG